MKTVLLFGTFDGLHRGHEAMFKEAWQLGEKIVVVLALDKTIKELKGKDPKYSFVERSEALEASGFVDSVVPGDESLGTYKVIDLVKPDVIAFGYDQGALRENLLAHMKERGQSIATQTLSAFEPDKYKSSILNV
jgi:cytidyltransferase-like protein